MAGPGALQSRCQCRGFEQDLSEAPAVLPFITREQWSANRSPAWAMALRDYSSASNVDDKDARRQQDRLQEHQPARGCRAVTRCSELIGRRQNSPGTCLAKRF